MKKILITILTVTAAFILGASLTLYASSDWQLEADGYYYLKEGVLTDVPKVIETHNGNPIMVVKANEADVQRTLMSYKTNISLSSDGRTYNFVESDGQTTGLSFPEGSTAYPLVIKYKALDYNPSDPGDLGMLGYSANDYDLVQITEEEFTGLSKRSFYIKIEHDPTFGKRTDKQFVKWYLKHFYNDHNTWYESTKGRTYSLEDSKFAIYDVVLKDYVYYKVLFSGDITEINGYHQLPTTTGNFENGLDGIGTVFINKISPAEYDLQINYANDVYLLKVNNIPEYIALSKKVHYFTADGSRYFVGFYEADDGWIENTSVSDDIIDNSWIVWNATTGKFTRSETNTIHAKVTSKSKGLRYTNQLWAEVVIPHDIDDLISMNVAYQYRHVYLIGKDGAWQTVNEQLLLKNEKSDFELPWYNSLFGFYNWAINSNRVTRDWFSIDQIEELAVDAAYKQEYVEWMNEKNIENNINKVYTPNEIFSPNSKTYALYLGTFNKFGSVNLDIKNFAVMKYRYEHKGVVYSNPFPKTQAPDNVHNESPVDPVIGWFKDLIGKAWSFIVSYSWIAIPFIGLATAPLIINASAAIFGNKVKKKRLLIVIGWIAVLLSVWFLLV